MTTRERMEVAAGMDLVWMRRQYGRRLAMLGGVDRREVANGRAAIDRELACTAPFIADGCCIPWIDHAVPPDTSLADFEYYLDQKRRILLDQPG